MDPHFKAIHEKVYVVTSLTICFSYVIQLLALYMALIKMWMSREIPGISINFLLFEIVAWLFKYIDDEHRLLTIPKSLWLVCIMQYLVQFTLLILMVLTILTSFCFMIFYDKKFEDKFNVWCFSIGFIVSFILGADNYGSTAEDRWMIGSYLDIAAWILQLELYLKRKSIDFHVMLFMVGVFIYEILNITGLSYDFYRLSLYENVGYKLVVLKVLLFCGFFLSYLKGMYPMKNEVNKVLPVAPAPDTSKKNLRPKKISAESVHGIRVENNVTLAEQGLMPHQ